jgi:uncharacterized protein (DUF885 family)
MTSADIIAHTTRILKAQRGKKSNSEHLTSSELREIVARVSSFLYDAIPLARCSHRGGIWRDPDGMKRCGICNRPTGEVKE